MCVLIVFLCPNCRLNIDAAGYWRGGELSQLVERRSEDGESGESKIRAVRLRMKTNRIISLHGMIAE